MATLGGEARTPGADLRIAIVGPATSLALAAMFGASAAVLSALDVAHILVSVAGWLSGINLLLALFNLIPGAPLDGGRILRAYLWRRHGDRVRAAVGAARAGRVVAFGLIGLGLLQFAAGGSVAGLWTVFIGWFLLTAARAEQADVLTRQMLDGVRVADVMTAEPRTSPAWFTVDKFVDRYVLGDRHSAYPVQGFDGQIEGLVTLAQVRAVPSEARATTRIGEVAIPFARVPTAAPGEPLLGLLERMSPETGGRALVLDAGKLVGIVTATDVTRAVEIRALGSRPPKAPPDLSPGNHRR